LKGGYSVTGRREILHAIPCGLNSEEIVGYVNNRLIRINQKFDRPSLMKLKRIGQETLKRDHPLLMKSLNPR
jgi:hypothetical protein